MEYDVSFVPILIPVGMLQNKSMCKVIVDENIVLSPEEKIEVVAETSIRTLNDGEEGIVWVGSI